MLYVSLSGASTHPSGQVLFRELSIFSVALFEAFCILETRRPSSDTQFPAFIFPGRKKYVSNIYLEEWTFSHFMEVLTTQFFI